MNFIKSNSNQLLKKYLYATLKVLAEQIFNDKGYNHDFIDDRTNQDELIFKLK